MKVLEKLGWKPPSSKDSGITDADTLFNETTIKHVKKFYDEEVVHEMPKEPTKIYSDNPEIQAIVEKIDNLKEVPEAPESL